MYTYGPTLPPKQPWAPRPPPGRRGGSVPRNAEHTIVYYTIMYYDILSYTILLINYNKLCYTMIYYTIP